MRTPPDEPLLTAYALGERHGSVVPSEDPLLQAEIGEIQAIERFLTERLRQPGHQLQPPQREAIRRAAREADLAQRTLSFPPARVLKLGIFAAAAAALVMLAAFMALRAPEPNPPAVAVIAPLPDAVPEAPTAAPLPAPPAIAERFSASTSNPSSLRLPIFTGRENLKVVADFIRTDLRLPPPSAVRVEEILNQFPLRLHGITAVARSAANTWHPDNRDSGMSAHVATLSTETIACPWKPSATLLVIHLRGNPRAACDVRISYQPDLDRVSKFHLLGFAPGGDPPTASVPTKLPPDGTTTLAIEIESSRPGEPLGSLVWSTDDQPAPTLSLIHKAAAEPSDDARFAALVCTYAQWLAGEQAGIIQAETVAALAREIASPTLSAEQADFLNLIESSLHL